MPAIRNERRHRKPAAKASPRPRAGSTTQTRVSLKTVGLFAGIGGFELGLRAAGHEPILLCEIEPLARAVLARHFDRVACHDDIRTLRALPAETDLVTAGFPCQDLSQAGTTAGIDGLRSGLIREVFRLLRRRRVPWLLLENVPFMLQLGGGRALEVIVAALEDLGYRWAYRIVNAEAFGLPQRRHRVFLVASIAGDPRQVLFADDAPKLVHRTERPVACGFYWTEGLRGLGWAIDAIPTLKGGSSIGVPSPPAVLLPDGRIVTPSLRAAERLQGFPDDWTLPAEQVGRRGSRWKLVGNAVSVPVATWLGHRLARPGRSILNEVQPLAAGAPWPSAAFNVGDGRYSNSISLWPVSEPRSSLAEFIDSDHALLSRRATAGFLGRTERASLKFPPKFIPAVTAHLERMEMV